MIRFLSIRNLAVIESVSVEFSPGFNVLTGETGAGKSILVEAVGLLLGGRASADMVRTGAELAVIDAIFEDDGREISLRRELSPSGRSRAYVDGHLATASGLKDLASRLVELHGQHEHQQLLDPVQHIALLDAWAGLEANQQKVAQAFQEVADTRQQLDRVRMDSRERAARLDFVTFQHDELAKADLRPGEDEELTALRDMLRSAEVVKRLCAESYADLYDDEEAVLVRLARVWKRIGELASFDPRFGSHLEQRDPIKAQLSDLASLLRDFAERVDTSPGRLEQVEERLALLERLKRKHGPALGDVLARRDALAAERDGLAADGQTPEALEQRLTAASATFLELARALSQRRRQAAGQFGRALETELAALAMEQARFDVRLACDDREACWTHRGIDTGEFFFSANPGEELRPLARIVSGGELSRVMLAIKTLAASDRFGRTLIFDEVDAGIGGRVATVVGEKLARLGGRFQVLCITHLPAIAAAGSAHFFIEKRVADGRTLTSVTQLDDDGRIAELARMIGGARAGEQARATARELLSPVAGPAGRRASDEGESRSRGRKRK